MRFVVFNSKRQASILLEDVYCRSDGCPVKGVVVNGGWAWRWEQGEILACNGEEVVTRAPYPCIDVMKMPEDLKGGYNAVLAWADAHPELIQHFEAQT